MNRIFKTTLLASLLTLYAGASAAEATKPGREKVSINDNWEFKLPDADMWEAVNIPHTYNQDAYRGTKYYRGKAQYRRRLNMPGSGDSEAARRRYFLRFDGVNKSADVSLNGMPVASHNGGYSSFTFDVTPFIKDHNVIEMTVDNDRPDIAPISADFTFFGGIYRDAWLISTPQIHFNLANHGSDGIFISTPEVSEEKASVSVKSEVTNDSGKEASITVTNNLFAPDGSLLQSFGENLKLKPGETASVNATSVPVPNPILWTPETPALYTVTIVLSDASSGTELERLSHKTAFRWFSFSPDSGFSLNGKPYKLRGFNRHQDQWPVGTALPDEAHRRDIRLMKDLGANFIRIAHYPQDDAILDACDELGLLVWEEIPIVNIVPDTPGFDNNCETNLREMIRQHFNHPSVMAWGYMNEILLKAPADNSDDWPATRQRTLDLAHRLEHVVRTEDPSRASVMAFHGSDRYNQIGLNITDVSGWNLYQGWYGADLEDFDKFCEDQHRRYPHKPIIISEWGAGSDRRLHSDNSRPFDFSTEYQQKYIEHYLPVMEKNDWIAGGAYWNLIDFNVAERQESMPRTNNKGVLHNDRTPKDVAYYFKAMWREDIPVIHIASRDRQLRTSRPGELHPVKIYSNLPEVELLVNGTSAGAAVTSNYSATFMVQLPLGESSLVARATGNDKAEDCLLISVQDIPDASSLRELAVNTGSNCDFTSSLTGLTWLADKPYEPGSWGFTGGSERTTTSEISATDDGPLYQTWREGDFSWRADVPEGNYEVELLTADVSRPAPQLPYLLDRSASEKESGTASFDILINGKTIEKEFSPAQYGHFRTAVKRRYLITADERKIEVTFRPITGRPSLSAIKIRKIP